MHIHPDLQPFVRHVWTAESTGGADVLHSFSFFADGCPGFMFGQSGNQMYLNGDQPLAPLFFYGQTVKPIQVSVRGKFRMVVLQLYPHVLKSVLGVNASDLTDDCVDVNVLPLNGVKTIGEDLLQTAQLPDQNRLMQRFLLGLIEKKQARLDRALQHAVSQLIQSGGGISLRKLRQELHFTERTFERRFEQHVGVSPSLFARICRFQTSLLQLKHGNYQKLSDVAYANGYADQSHFIRTFKEFAGFSPFRMKFRPQPVE